MDLLRYPYASHRTPVLATNGVVATSQPLAAQAGLEMLLGGGNAVDAAIAAAGALTVVEPTSTGIGGDAFAMVWDGRRLHGINGSGRWPARMDPERLRAEGHMQVPEQGGPASPSRGLRPPGMICTGVSGGSSCPRSSREPSATPRRGSRSRPWYPGCGADCTDPPGGG